MTQADLAEVFGVSQSAVSRWLKGTDTPGKQHWPDLAVFLRRPDGEIEQMLIEVKVSRSSSAQGRRIAQLERDLADVQAQVARLGDMLTQFLAERNVRG